MKEKLCMGVDGLRICILEDIASDQDMRPEDVAPGTMHL